MDPVSITATIISLATFGFKVASFVEQLITESPAIEIEALLHDLQALCTVLTRLQTFSTPTLEDILPPQLLEDLAPILESCMDLFQKTNGMVMKMGRGGLTGRMRWMSKEREVTKLRGAMVEHKLTLNMTFTVASCITTYQVQASTSRIEARNEEILSKLEQLLEQEAGVGADRSVIMQRFLADVRSSYGGTTSASSTVSEDNDHQRLRPPGIPTLLLTESEMPESHTPNEAPMGNLISPSTLSVRSPSPVDSISSNRSFVTVSSHFPTEEDCALQQYVTSTNEHQLEEATQSPQERGLSGIETSSPKTSSSPTTNDHEHLPPPLGPLPPSPITVSPTSASLGDITEHKVQPKSPTRSLNMRQLNRYATVDGTIAFISAVESRPSGRRFSISSASSSSSTRPLFDSVITPITRTANEANHHLPSAGLLRQGSICTQASSSSASSGDSTLSSIGRVASTVATSISGASTVAPSISGSSTMAPSISGVSTVAASINGASTVATPISGAGQRSKTKKKKKKKAGAVQPRQARQYQYSSVDMSLAFLR